MSEAEPIAILPEEEQVVEAESTDQDGDSTDIEKSGISELSGITNLESAYFDAASVTTSIKSFVRSKQDKGQQSIDYKMEHGRRYHAFEREKCFVPNDEPQQNQMDLLYQGFKPVLMAAASEAKSHAVYSKAMAIHMGDTVENPRADRLYLAPMDTYPKKVLDLGTGTGIWAICFADEHPNAEVIGTDLSPIQPDWVPPNLKFEFGDFEEDWPWEPNTFDYIHARSLHGAVSDWQKLLQRSYDALKPGGWLEICDEEPFVYSDDNTLPADSHTKKWLADSVKILEMIGRPATQYTALDWWLPSAGFDPRTVKHKRMKLPIGIWPKDRVLKEIGGMMVVGLLSGLEGWVIDGYTKVLKIRITGQRNRGHLSSNFVDLRRVWKKHRRLSVMYQRSSRTGRCICTCHCKFDDPTGC